MMTKTVWRSGPTSGSSHGISRLAGTAAVNVPKRFCVIRVPPRAWPVGLGLAVGITIAAGGSASADERSGTQNVGSAASSSSPFKKCTNQTYALCAVAGCFVFNEVAYCK